MDRQRIGSSNLQGRCHENISDHSLRHQIDLTVANDFYSLG